MRKKILLISDVDCHDLRSRILRPGQPLKTCIYPGDTSPEAFHLGVFVNHHMIPNHSTPNDLTSGALASDALASGALASVGSFVPDHCPNFPLAIKPYRLRGMATDTAFQKNGLASLILQTAETKLIELGCDLIWFNARESAFGFYKKNGFHIIGDMFDIPLAGPHKVMYKWLDKRYLKS